MAKKTPKKATKKVRKKCPSRGGYREGAGRPRELNGGRSRNFILEERQMTILRLYAQAHGHRTVSEALRAILDGLEA